MSAIRPRVHSAADVVLALGGPFELQAWYAPAYGTLAIIFVTLALPLLEKALVR